MKVVEIGSNESNGTGDVTTYTSPAGMLSAGEGEGGEEVEEKDK